MWIALAVVVLVLLAVGLGRYLLFVRPLPRLSGREVVQGISAEVEILRDRHGVPHIFAKTIEDAVFAQGFCHVQDRWFQMELNRRIGSGTLSEVLGPLTVEADRFLRRMMLRRTAEREVEAMEPEERRVVEAYCRGVNQAMAAMGSRIPLEFKLLGIKPTPWTPVDSLCWAKVMALNLCTNWDVELFRYRLIQKVGLEEAMRLEMRYPHGGTVVVPPGALHDSDAAAAELQKLFNDAAQFLPLGLPGASNNWVVSGERTKSGKPMLANDPHLLLQVPNIWYEVHLVAEDVDVYGVSLPGDPGVVIGHTRHAAWGFTNSNADVQDLYLEKFHPDDPKQVEWKGQFEPVQLLREVIKVKGQDDVIEELRVTRHGPVIAGGQKKGELGIAMKWAAHEPGHLFSAVLQMNRAQSAQDIKDALKKWHTPSQNVVFADDQGNIGYVMAGVVPIRAKGSGLTPVPGWTGEYEWIGWVPFEELPQAWNPESGYVATANNAVVDRSYKHHITWDYMNGYRAGRIEELILSKPKLDADDFRQIQMDVFTRPGLAFAQACRGLRVADNTQQLALEYLQKWDGHARANSVGAAVYEAMMLFVLERALRPRLGRELFDDIMGKAAHPLAPAGLVAGRYTGYLLEAMQRQDPYWLQASPGYASWEQLLLGALKDACDLLAKQLGDDVQRWEWGRLHQLHMRHPLGRVKVLAPLFNGPSVPMGGDSDSPLQTAYAAHAPFGVDAWAPSWRQVVDFADVKKTRSVHASGQSGHRGSPHYLDQFELWHAGRYHEQWLDRAEIEANLEGRIELTTSR